ncbi:OmpA family protein [Thiovibrio sp. JS02]
MKRVAVVICLLLGVFSWAAVGLADDALNVQSSWLKAKLNVEPVAENKVLVSVLNEEGEPVLGLTKADFLIRKGPKTAQILSVEDVKEQREVGLNLVLVVDNSYSMKLRDAIDPVLAALNDFLSLIRPIDNVHIVTFVDPRNGYGEVKPGQIRVTTKSEQGNDPALLSQILRSSYFPSQTEGTYLYDAMQEGLKIIGAMPEKSQKFMVVFSDGEDINSTVKANALTAAAASLRNFTFFAVDFMDRPGLDPFLHSFAQAHNGRIRKAKSAEDFLPIFKQFSSTIFHRYAVTFRFLAPPTGVLNGEPAAVNIEEVTMVDSSPLLNYVYFETGKSEIPERYVTFASPEMTRDFAEEKLTGTMEKYHHILNVLGKRLQQHPEARISIVGCNANAGEEKGGIALSRSRADAVFAYFKYVWGIDPARMEVKARNLPEAPSTGRVAEGSVENQRVEIYSDTPAILDTIKSTYVLEQCDAAAVRILPAVQAEAGVEGWRFRLLGGEKELLTREGIGDVPLEFSFATESLGLREIAAAGRLSAEIEVKDREQNVFTAKSQAPITVNFIRREERIAQKLETKVVEKYGLILFEFDRTDLKDRNQVIVNRVITRMAELASPHMEITGHTDSIGKEKYNLELSERRAAAVYDAMLNTGLVAEEEVGHAGKGPNDPPYDNELPEGRALNRTVIITLSYTE